MWCQCSQGMITIPYITLLGIAMIRDGYDMCNLLSSIKLDNYCLTVLSIICNNKMTIVRNYK